MAGLKVYVDLMSQPSRAVLLFLKANKIPHETKIVSIAKGEHKTQEFMNTVHQFGKLPAINDNGVQMIESVAILRYLARKHNVNDHWYPKDLIGQARVDEFIEWHHLGLRAPLSWFFILKFIKPLMTGKQPNADAVTRAVTGMEEALTLVENVWLKNTPYLTGDKISIADLMGVCEIEQPRAAGYDPTVGKPKLKAWMERLRNELNPDYDEVMKIFNKVAAKAPKSNL